MAYTNSNSKVVPEAREALNKFKYEVASEVGVNLKQGYNGDISARDAGKIGGQMVRKLIQQAESRMIMAYTNSNSKVVPEAREALNKFKYEVASEVGVNLKQGYNGDISARDAGKIGGQMVRKLIQQAESQMK